MVSRKSALFSRAKPTMAARQAVLLTPPKPSGPIQLLFCQQNAPVSPLFATLAGAPQPSENTATLSPLFATLTASAPVSPVVATLTKTPGVSNNNSHFGTRPSFSSPPLTAPSSQTTPRRTSSLPSPVTIHQSPLLLPPNPLIHMHFQNAQRHRPVLQHRIMKLALIKFGSQPLLRLRTQTADLQLPQLVRQRLPRPHNVPVHLDSNVLIRLPRVVLEKLDGLLACPPHRIHARTHHQPHRPPHLVRQLPEFRVRILVQPDLFAKALRIQRPTFDERGVTHVLAEFRHIFQFLPQRNLQMMPGHGFVQRQRFHLPFRPRVQVVRIHE